APGTSPACASPGCTRGPATSIGSAAPGGPSGRRCGGRSRIGIVVGNHLAAAREADGRAVVAAVLVFELLAVPATGGVALDPSQDAVVGHVRAAPHPDVIAAGEVELPVFEPPGHVQAHAPHAVVVGRYVVHHLGDEAPHVR